MATTTETKAPETTTSESTATKPKRQLQAEQYVFLNQADAEANPPQDEAHRWRLYRIQNPTNPTQVAFVWERVAMMATGRAAEHFGWTPELANPASRSRVITMESVTAWAAELDEESKKALLKQLTGKK